MRPKIIFHIATYIKSKHKRPIISVWQKLQVVHYCAGPAISNYRHLHFNIMFYKFDQFSNILGTCRQTFLQVITQQRIYTPVRISPAGVKSRWWVLVKRLLFVIMLLPTNFCNSFRNCKDVFSYNPHYAGPKSCSTWA